MDGFLSESPAHLQRWDPLPFSVRSLRDGPDTDHSTTPRLQGSAWSPTLREPCTLKPRGQCLSSCPLSQGPHSDLQLWPYRLHVTLVISAAISSCVLAPSLSPSLCSLFGTALTCSVLWLSISKNTPTGFHQTSGVFISYPGAGVLPCWVQLWPGPQDH